MLSNTQTVQFVLFVVKPLLSESLSQPSYPTDTGKKKLFEKYVVFVTHLFVTYKIYPDYLK